MSERIQVLTFDEMMALPNPRFTVGGLFPQNGLALIAGKELRSTSLAVLDMACKASIGHRWAYSSTRPGPWVYFDAHATASDAFTRNVLAWESHHGGRKANVKFVPQPCVVDDPKDVTAFIEYLRRGPPPSVVVIDPIVRCMSGKSEHMFMHGVWKIQSELKCAVVLVDERPPIDLDRDSNAMTCSVDVILYLDVVKASKLRLRFIKNRNAREADPIDIELRRVTYSYRRATAEGLVAVPCVGGT